MKIIKIIMRIIGAILLIMGALTTFLLLVVGCSFSSGNKEVNPDLGKPFISDINHRLYPENGFKKPVDLIDDFYGIRSLEQQGKIYESNIFQIYNGLQGGIYTYDAWLEIPEHGRIYLRAYDLLSGLELTPETIRTRSSLEVRPTDGKINRFTLEDTFTIYEGDWGEYYAAKFELWYVALTGPNQVPKILLEDYYIVDGWER